MLKTLNSDFSQLRRHLKTIVNKFAVLNHTALILGMHALRSYLKLICEYGLHSLPTTKISGAKDHGKNYIKVRPPLVRHLLRNRLYHIIIHIHSFCDVRNWHQRTFNRLQLSQEIR